MNNFLNLLNLLKLTTVCRVGFLALCVALVNPPRAQALELDWSGQFRYEFNFIHDYTEDLNANGNYDPARAAAGGYYIPGGGNTDANYQNLFLRLRPKLVINDNIYIKSEWWLGDPVYGIFGNAVPYSTDQNQFYSNQSRGSTITAQRFWAEILSDFGTVQIGRLPLDWGLGVVWNAGDGLFDRYESTGDAVRLISKFGAFSFIPSFINASSGNAVGGGCSLVGGACTPTTGGGGVTDYSLILKYENPDEDFDVGVNFIKRLIGPGQDANSGYFVQGTTQAANYNTWDIYGKKKIGRFSFAAEVPITSGFLGASNSYSTLAIATEIGVKITDSLDAQIKAGRAPGQPGDLSTFKAFYFNPAYHIGLIIFNYQFANFAGPNTLNNAGTSPATLRSPYDNPIVDANYLSATGVLHAGEKWSFKAGLIYAQADQTAAAGQPFWNNYSRKVVANAAKDQSNSLGWEMDYGTSFQWDEYFTLGLDFGFYFPGDFYKFSNTAFDNSTNYVFGTAFRVGVVF